MTGGDQNQNGLLVKRQIDNTTPGGWGLTGGDQNQNGLLVKRQIDNTTPGGWGLTGGDQNQNGLLVKQGTILVKFYILQQHKFYLKEFVFGHLLYILLGQLVNN